MPDLKLKNLVAKSPHKQWSQSREITLEFPHLNYKNKLVGLSALYEFFEDQVNAWSNEGLPEEFKESKLYFERTRDNIESFALTYLSDDRYGVGTLNQEWHKRVYLQIHETNRTPFIYGLPETNFLLKLHKENPAYVEGAFLFFTQDDTSRYLKKQNHMIGALLAYEFKMKDYTEIVARRDKEKRSLSRLRTNFQNYLNISEKEIVDHLAAFDSKFQSAIISLDTLKNGKKKIFDDWYEKSDEKYRKIIEDAEEKKKALEDTYESLLRLKGPAEYWTLRAKKLRREGLWYLIAMFLLLAICCGTLYLLLWKTPEGMLVSFEADTASAIRWSIVYIMFISLLVYGIRVTHKLSFSTSHLARDAEEREQLTHMYLSLIKENALDEEDRNLILQSLFSRADTGLLTEDSSPTMPNDIVSRFINKS